jgi:hypothetical protein
MKYVLRKIKSLNFPEIKELNFPEIKSLKYDVMICCSLFKMKDSYRDFSKYVKNFLSWIYKVPKTACVRLYVDESVLTDESFKILFDKNIPHLEIIFYQFDDFKVFDSEDSEGSDGIKNSVYHDGTFGSIVRFLAFYNKPSIPDTIKYIWVSDVDLPAYTFDYDNITRMKRMKADISFYSKACNNNEWFPDSSENPINAGKVIISRKVKPNFKDFENYLSDVLNNKYEELKQRIMKNREGRQHYSPAKFFTYGFDELFLNTYFVKVVKKYNHLIYYEITLDTFRKYIDDPIFEEYKKIDNEIWNNPLTKNTKENKLKLREINDRIYQKIETVKDDIKSKRLKICIKDYDKYRNKISYDKSVWGLTTIIFEKRI